MTVTSKTTAERQGGEGAGNGPWDEPAITQLRAWDPSWADMGLAVAANPWRSGVLPRKTVELISIGLNAACTNLNADGVRRHVRGALSAGASRDEILMVFKMASLLSIHSCSLGAPILLEEARAAGVPAPTGPPAGAATPVCDATRKAGMWNEAWTPFFDLDPTWTEQFIAAGIPTYAGGVFSAKDAELLSIAFDASVTHMYAPGTQRHIKAALKDGASVGEIMEVLKLCVAQGVQAFNLGAPILAEEEARYAETGL
jgi:alkylhydroperoxidase/carboxymuconolactone decarboxylase family protein YurZ